jgi:hypothetical protein
MKADTINEQNNKKKFKRFIQVENTRLTAPREGSSGVDII